MYCSSADLMERNLSNRIEVCFPILKKKHANRIMQEMEIYLDSPAQTWELDADGTYHERVTDANELLDVQNQLLHQLAQI
ncbi:MAG: hypothetical protein OXU30_07970 [Gammaproteobacteria bacterium]|nr:hypothetical protein [Gammaproteobacteria bacterium]